MHSFFITLSHKIEFFRIRDRNTMKKRELSDEQKIENFTLKEIFNRKKAELELKQELLAEKLGISQSGLNHYLNGTNLLNAQIASQFARELRISVDDFSERLAEEIRQMAKMVNNKNSSISIQGSNHGTQNYFTGQSQTNTVNNNFLPSEPHSGSLKKIVMPDNAMLPTFPQGSELTIDTSQTAIIDGKIYQIQSGERFFIRKIFSQISGSLKIVCDNPEFESVIVSSDSVQIVGRVIEWRVRD